MCCTEAGPTELLRKLQNDFQAVANSNLFLQELCVCFLSAVDHTDMEPQFVHNQRSKALIHLAKRMLPVVLMIVFNLVCAYASPVRAVLHASHAAEHGFCSARGNFSYKKVLRDATAQFYAGWVFQSFS